MRASACVFLFITIIAAPSTPLMAAGKNASVALSQLSDEFEVLSQKVSPAVVQVFTTGYGREEGGSSEAQRQRGTGSGVIVDPDGYILTNAHVVEGALRVEVALAGLPTGAGPSASILKPRGRLVSARLIGLDTETDLAVLKVSETGLPFLPMADSDALRSGQLVFAFGSPFGLENSVTMGIVSAVARQLRPEDPMIYIQTDAPINPGNSGGPLVDTDGRVVGINTFILTRSGGSEGIGFAAPANIAQSVYLQIRANGRVHRGEIGASAQTITPTLAAGLGLSQEWGVVIGDVIPNSGAERAGLQIGDVILTVGGKIVENGRQFDVNVYRRAEGERVTLEVLRGKEKLTLDVSVTSRQDDSREIRALARPGQDSLPALGILGLDMSDELAKMIPSLRKQYGVVVAARTTDAPHWAAGFRPGDVIHSINGELITGMQLLRERVAALKTGAPVVLQIERAGRLQYVAFEME